MEQQVLDREARLFINQAPGHEREQMMTACCGARTVHQTYEVSESLIEFLCSP